MVLKPKPKAAKSTAVRAKGSVAKAMEVKAAKSTAVRAKGSVARAMEVKAAKSTTVRAKGSVARAMEVKAAKSTSVRAKGSVVRAMEIASGAASASLPFGPLGLPGADTVHQALPVHVPARTSASGEDAATLSQAEIDDRVAEILRQCLRAHGGSFDPSKISHSALGLGPQHERMYSRLNKLLLPKQLRPFVDRHPEFSYQEKDPKGMLITWASPASTGLPAPSSASCDQPACAPSSASASMPAHQPAGVPSSASASVPSLGP